MDSIHYNFIDVEIPDFNPEFFDLWLSKIVGHYKKELTELSFIFCSDEYLLKMNKEHLEHDYYTDVITFNYNEGSSLSGDVFMSVDRMKENTNEFGNSNLHDEVCRIMAHGLLHLIGYNDKSDEESAEMKVQEEACLSKR